MSKVASSTAASGAEASAGIDWGLAARQARGVLRLEIGRQLFGRRALAAAFLAFAPPMLLVLWVFNPLDAMQGPLDATPLFAGLYAGYHGTALFLGCLVLFMSAYRSDILERSLHYYFLTPVRREVLTVAKYLAALCAAALFFSLGTALLFFMTFVPWGFGELGRYLAGPGLGNLMTYVGLSILGCIGYGALFLLFGQLFRNPVVPGVVFWGWEFLNPFLPALLKKLSVTFYLRSLYPVPVSTSTFAVFADPMSPWIAVPGLLLFSALVLALASWRARTMEIHYGGD
ncbi:MAG: hypothetical protein AAGC60_12520 [Acidobacteriota bacterium]